MCVTASKKDTVPVKHFMWYIMQARFLYNILASDAALA